MFRFQGRRESRRGPEKHSRGALWEKNFEFLKMAHSGVLYILERRRGPKRDPR